MVNTSTAARRRAEPLWRPAHRLSRAGIPEKYLPWLLDPASLTERIVNRCGGNFRVRLLDQRRIRPLRNEADVLGMRAGTRAIVRQVQLMCGDTPWVYARTIIPPKTFARKSHRFTTLGARSLGAMLFSDPSMKRGEVEVTSLTPSDRLYHLVTRDLRDKPETIWGRRSLFRLGGKPLLVCEFFLPDIAEF
jgi:chorismate--pyruvate lyase